MSKTTSIERDMKKMLKESGNESPIYDELIQEYVEMCEDLDGVRELIDQIKDDPKQGSLYIRALSRKSQIEKDKRSMLRYLGIIPSVRREEPAEEEFEL